MMNKNKKILKKIADMTIEEKALQLTQYPANDLLDCGNSVITGVTVTDGMTDDLLIKAGSVLNAADGVAVNELRKLRRDKGIDEPLIVMHDVIHGYRTIFPIPLAMACSFDTELTEACAEVAANEARLDGIDVTFSPVVDLCRDARWGRCMESGGEDPYLNGEIGKAFIRGYHKGGIACCVKHFAAYGGAEGGRDYDTVELSEHTLREYYLKPYYACLRENPDLVMTSFNVIDGTPIIANSHLMLDILRKEWKFADVVISDYAAVNGLKKHGFAENDRKAASVAAHNKLNIEMCSPAYALNIPELVKSGELTENEVDELVYPILALKDKLGLYENPNRYTNPKKYKESALCAEYRKLARTAAARSCVLLKNDGNVLPLRKTDKIAVVGPFADSKEIIGEWACRGDVSEAVSVKEGITNVAEQPIAFARGCERRFTDTENYELSQALTVAGSADKILICIGEHSCESGEAHSRAKLELPAEQVELVKNLAALGKPTVCVVFAGRPLVLTEIEPYVQAILYVWQPGTEGGNGIADILFGIVNPSGKLTMSFPRSTGQCPIYYNRLSTERTPHSDMPFSVVGRYFLNGYDDEYNSPLYPFGYGLSYTKFEYSGLRLSSDSFEKNGKITASVTVKNIGQTDGIETVQWYLRDLYASKVRPIKELKGFERVELKSGESKIVKFEICEDTLKFFAENNIYTAESGKFELFVGGNSRDCCSSVQFCFIN